MLLIVEIVICRLQWWVTVLNLPPVSTAHSGLYCMPHSHVSMEMWLGWPLLLLQGCCQICPCIWRSQMLPASTRVCRTCHESCGMFMLCSILVASYPGLLTPVFVDLQLTTYMCSTSYSTVFILYYTFAVYIWD